MCPGGSQLTYLVWPALESHFQKWLCFHNHTLGKCITKRSWLCPPSHRGHTYIPGALNAGNLGRLTLTFFLGWVLWVLEGDSLMAVAASAPLLPSTSISLITAINKQPLATSPAGGRGGSRAFTTLGEKLVSYLGQVGVHVSEGTGQQRAFPTSAAPPEGKAPSSWGHLQKCMFHFARKSGSKSIFSKPCWGTR